MVNRRYLLGALALYPLLHAAETEASPQRRRRRERRRKRKERRLERRRGDVRFLWIVDHTPPDSGWQRQIEKAIAMVNPRLPEGYPPLVYVREAVTPAQDQGVPGEIHIWLVPYLRTPKATAEAIFVPRPGVPGNAAVIHIRDVVRPNPGTIVHEFHHCLTGQSEHTGWQLWDVPFDPTQIMVP